MVGLGVHVSLMLAEDASLYSNSLWCNTSAANVFSIKGTG